MTFRAGYTNKLIILFAIFITCAPIWIEPLLLPYHTCDDHVGLPASKATHAKLHQKTTQKVSHDYCEACRLLEQLTNSKTLKIAILSIEDNIAKVNVKNFITFHQNFIPKVSQRAPPVNS